MNIPNSTILRKAIAIKTELEHLDHQLNSLLATVSSQEAKIASKKIASKALKKPLKESSQEAVQSEAVQSEVLHDTKEEAEVAASLGDSMIHHDSIGIISSSKPHQETLLLVDDSGEEQLSLVQGEVTQIEVVCEYEPQVSPQESSENSSESQCSIDEN